MKFYKEYVLLKDTLESEKGSSVKWDLWRDLYTTNLVTMGKSDKTEETFTKETVESKKDWFKPISNPVEFYAKFPDDFGESHFYFGELRHNKMCRFCTIAQDVLDSVEYENQVTDLFKKLYDKKVLELSNEQVTRKR